MIESLPGRKRFVGLALIVLLAILFFLTLHQSWAGWFEPIADTGRDLYIPEKIAQGEIKLYRDVSYLYPPLAPYLIAVIVAGFGSDFGVMATIGIVTAGLIAILLFSLGHRTAGLPAAAVLTILFISIHMTGVSGYSFNFIFPYSHNAIFGFLFILAFLYALVRYASYGGDTFWLGIALVTGSLSGWSKIEYAAAFLILLAASVLVRRPRLGPIALAGAANLVIVVFLAWYFADAPPERHWLLGNILPERLLSGGVARAFYARIQGLDAPWTNLALSAEGALLIFAAIASIAGIGRLRGKAKNIRIPGTILLALVLLGIEYSLSRHFLLFRGCFLLQLILIPWAIRERKRTPLFLLLVFSLLLGSRVLLRLEPTWYGFLFAIPAEIVLIYVLFEELPRRSLYRRPLALLWLPLFASLGIAALIHQRQVYESRIHNVVHTTRGVFHDRLPDRAEAFDELFSFLNRRHPHSMAVVPEGLAINWLARIPTSIPYHTFSPAEMPDAASQQEIIDAIRKDPPEIILLVRRDYGEFGYVGIGVDYGKELIEEIECLYEPSSYRESERFYLVVMERKPSRTCL